MIIEYLGKSVDTKHFDGVLEPEKIQYVRDNYYTENKDLALKQLKGCLLEGKTNTNHIYNYYFERIAADTIFYITKWSINQALASDELVQLFINKTKINDKVFEGKDLVKDFKTALRLAGKGYASKPSNFPLKECVSILKALQDLSGNGKIYLDPCCGWGIRLLASAILDLDYIGFDVNANLIPKLKELAEDIKTIKPNFRYMIFEQGSQYLVPELIGCVDFCFTSPPYFNLEDYGNNDLEKQDSYRTTNYNQWVEMFVNPLIDCLIQYTKPIGKIAFNVKDFKGYPLVQSFTKSSIDRGLMPSGYLSMKNITRVGGSSSGKKTFVDNDEGVYIFSK